MRRALPDLPLSIHCLTAGGLMLFVAGCSGLSTHSEKEARGHVAVIDRHYRPERHRPPLPCLEPNSGLADYVHYALLNQPSVEAAYYDWLASVEDITLARSLPDPTLGFQTDIADVVTSVMPGIMQVFPGPGKLRSRADLASARANVRYFAFESAVLQSAFELKRSFFELHFLTERIRINRENLALLRELETIARAQNEAGKVTLQDVLRAQILRDGVVTDLASLEDLRQPKLTAFKAALGLGPDDEDPPVPAVLEPTQSVLTAEELLELAMKQNPELRRLRGDIVAMQGAIAVAYKEKVPDFSLGLMADVKTSPIMIRPLAGMTLPIWRDKIAAGVAQANASELAAQARLKAEEIRLATAVAEKTFAYREVSRILTLLQHQLIPKAALSVEIARAGYLSGTIDFFNLIDAQRNLLAFQLSEVEARTRREIVLAELSLLIAGTAPAGAPLLADSVPNTPPTQP